MWDSDDARDVARRIIDPEKSIGEHILEKAGAGFALGGGPFLPSGLAGAAVGGLFGLGVGIGNEIWKATSSPDDEVAPIALPEPSAAPPPVHLVPEPSPEEQERMDRSEALFRDGVQHYFVENELPLPPTADGESSIDGSFRAEWLEYMQARVMEKEGGRSPEDLAKLKETREWYERDMGEAFGKDTVAGMQKLYYPEPGKAPGGRPRR